MDGKHTPEPGAGAIRAAEIITGCKSGDDKRYMTTRGPKTVRGLAAIIDDTTAATELLEACKYVVRWHRENDSGEGELYGLDHVTTCIAAIRKAEGGEA